MSCWCARLSAEEIAATELVLSTLGGQVTEVQVGRYPQVPGEPCPLHKAGPADTGAVSRASQRPEPGG